MDKLDYIEADDYYDMGCQWRVEREWEKAISCFKHVIELNRYFIYAYIDLAAVYARQGNYHDAVIALKKAVKLDPGFHLLHYNIAKYMYRHGELHGALKAIDEALILNDTELYERVRAVILKKMHS
jgi:tetratricopeptide (TPR) repeat protein